MIIHNDVIKVAVEFKYEPSRSRSSAVGGDIMKGKFPVVFWNEAEKDVRRVQEYVDMGQAEAAYSVFIDEGGAFNWRTPPDGSEWIEWSGDGWMLWCKESVEFAGRESVVRDRSIGSVSPQRSTFREQHPDIGKVPFWVNRDPNGNTIHRGDEAKCSWVARYAREPKWQRHDTLESVYAVYPRATNKCGLCFS